MKSLSAFAVTAACTLACAAPSLAGSLTVKDLYECKRTVDQGYKDTQLVGSPLVLSQKTEGGTISYQILTADGVIPVKVSMPIERPKFFVTNILNKSGKAESRTYRLSDDARSFVSATDKEIEDFTGLGKKAKELETRVAELEKKYKDAADKDKAADEQAKKEDLAYEAKWRKDHNDPKGDAFFALTPVEQQPNWAKYLKGPHEYASIKGELDKAKAEHDRAVAQVNGQTILQGLDTKLGPAANLPEKLGCEYLDAALKNSDGFKFDRSSTACAVLPKKLAEPEFAIHVKAVCRGGKKVEECDDIEPKIKRQFAKTCAQPPGPAKTDVARLNAEIKRINDDFKKRGIDESVAYASLSAKEVSRMSVPSVEFPGNADFDINFKCVISYYNKPCTTKDASSDVADAANRLTEHALSPTGACAKIVNQKHCGTGSAFAADFNWAKERGYGARGIASPKSGGKGLSEAK
jgi:hypothetical protein